MATNTNNSLAQWFSELNVPQNHLDVLLKTQIAGHNTHTVSDSVEPGVGLKVGISDGFPGDADAAALGTTLCENHQTTSPTSSLKGAPQKSAQLLRFLSGGGKKSNSCHDSLPFSSFSSQKMKNRKQPNWKLNENSWRNTWLHFESLRQFLELGQKT